MQEWAGGMEIVLTVASSITADTEAIRPEFGACNFSRLDMFNLRYFDAREELKLVVRQIGAPTLEAQVMSAALIGVLDLEIRADSTRSTSATLDFVQGSTPCAGGDANALDDNAWQAKVEFLAMYNPVAEHYGLRTWRPEDF